MKKEYNPAVREELQLQFQVEDQIKTLRYFMNIGDMKGVGRAEAGIKFLMWPWIPKDKKEQYAEIEKEYKPKQLHDFYTPEDREQIEVYGSLDDERHDEIVNLTNEENKRIYFEGVEKRIRLIMETFKILGMGFDESEDAYMSEYEKKKMLTAS